jgi:uncharacterized protein
VTTGKTRKTKACFRKEAGFFIVVRCMANVERPNAEGKMKIKTYQNGKDFLAEHRDFLEAEEAKNNLMLGIAQRTPADAGSTDDSLFLGLFDNNEPFASCVMTPSQRLVLYARDGARIDPVPFLSQHLKSTGAMLPGVIGPKEISERFARAWAREQACSYELNMNERIYTLETVSEIPMVDGNLRPAQASDMPLVKEWIARFTFEALHTTLTDDEIQRLVDSKLQRGAVFLWDDGGPVAMAGFSRQTTHGIAVNLVYTPPALRKRGYASSCVARLSRLLLERGNRFCVLFTDLANPVSNSIYQKIGYRPVCDFAQFDFLNAQRGE